MPIAYFLPPLILLAYLTYRKTRYGLYIVLATVPGYLLKTKIGFAPTTWLELAIYTVTMVSFYKHLKRKNLEAHIYYIMNEINQYVLPVALLLIAALISILFSENKLQALGILKAWFVAPLTFSLVFLDKVKSRATIKNVLFAASLSALPIILYGLFDYITEHNLTIPGRLDSFFTSPNYVTMYLVPLSVLILGFALLECIQTQGGNSALSINKKLLLYYSVWLALSFSTIFLTQSFGGWFGLAAGVLFLIIFVPRFNTKKALIAPLIFIALIIAGLLAYQKFYSHYDTFWQMNSLQTRRQLWTHSLALLSHNPIFGIGLADFQNTYNAYIQTLPPKKQPIEKDVLRPHNVYLDFWLETGIVGITAFLWIILIFYHKTMRHYAKARELLLVPGAAALFAMLTHGLLDTPYFKNDLSILFWFLVSVNVGLSLKQNKIPPATAAMNPE